MLTNQITTPTTRPVSPITHNPAPVAISMRVAVPAAVDTFERPKAVTVVLSPKTPEIDRNEDQFLTERNNILLELKEIKRSILPPEEQGRLDILLSRAEKSLVSYLKVQQRLLQTCEKETENLLKLINLQGEKPTSEPVLTQDTRPLAIINSRLDYMEILCQQLRISTPQPTFSNDHFGDALTRSEGITVGIGKLISGLRHQIAL